MKRIFLFLLMSVLFLTACGGSGEAPDSPKPSGFTLNKSSLNLLIGNTFQLIPSKTDIHWDSDDSLIAEVSTDGIVTGIAEGTAIITATTSDNEYTASCTVSVTSINIAVTSVTINMSSVEILVDGTIDLNETVSPQGATNPSVTWSSSNTYAATVDNNGVVKGVHNGSSVITVKTADGGKTAQCSVVVKSKPIPVTGITLDRSAAHILSGLGMQLKQKIVPDNATNKNITWSSSDTNIAEVTSTGIVTGKKSGEVEITVTTADGNIEATCDITVDEHPVITTGYFTRSMKSYSCYWVNTTIYELPIPSGYNGYAWNAAVENGNLYVTGRYENILWGVKAPCYWKNNELYLFPKPSGTSFDFPVVFINLINGNIYHGGSYVNTSSNRNYGAYWVNNVRHELPMPDGYEMGNIVNFDMLGNGKVLSVASLYSPTEHKTKICYWLDEEYHELAIPSGAVNISIESHSVSGNNVYLTVQYQIFDGPNTFNYRSYWINGVSHNLNVEGNVTVGGSSVMHVVDGKVYIVGSVAYSTNPDFLIPCYWVDNTRIELPLPANAFDGGSATSIVVSDGKIHVKGTYKTTNTEIPCYWVDSTRYDLSPEGLSTQNYLLGPLISNGQLCFAYKNKAYYWSGETTNQLTMPEIYQRFEYLTRLYVSNNDIYVMGFYENTSGYDTPCYWINNTRHDFENRSYINSMGTFFADSALYNFGGFQFSPDSPTTNCYWINTTRYDLEKLINSDTIYNEFIMRP